MKWCPKCRRLVAATSHSFHDGNGRLMRREVRCTSCHQTIEVHHYPSWLNPWRRRP